MNGTLSAVIARAECGGFSFGLGLGSELPVYAYLALRARGGDQDAADVLTAFGVTVTDSDGRPVWPAGDEPQPAGHALTRKG